MASAYNCGPYIAEAVESIQAQTFTEFAFIIIDHGSMDRSLRMLQRFAQLTGTLS